MSVLTFPGKEDPPSVSVGTDEEPLEWTEWFLPTDATT